ncbi:hypothetical protein CLU79DRAFT_735675 [Phycomyces nitens]|nr:hypothetical protein CLU79DRAFT_735675 [Phycomyces nitens]
MTNRQGTKHSRIDSPNMESFGLKSSTRNWNSKPEISQLPLVSRMTFSNEAAKGQSLANIDIQHDMWTKLTEKASQIQSQDNPAEWTSIVDLLRGLREGIYASQWSKGDLEFSVKVFEQSVMCCIQANNHNELLKSMRVLVDELYQIPSVTPKNYHCALYALFLVFYDRTSGLDRINELPLDLPENRFVRSVVRCVVVTKDPIQFYGLYESCPDRYFKLLLGSYMDKMRLISISVLRKAYLSVPIAWATYCLGLADSSQTVPTIDRLITPTCIDRLDPDTNTLYFVRNNKKVIKTDEPKI